MVGSYGVAVTIGAIIIWVCDLKHLNITVRVLLRHNTRTLHLRHMYQYEVLWKGTLGDTLLHFIGGELFTEGKCLCVYELSFVHKGFSSSNLYLQAVCLPGQVEERWFPVWLHQHHFQYNPLQQKKASHTHTALLLCPRLILGQQFLSLTQHSSIFTYY